VFFTLIGADLERRVDPKQRLCVMRRAGNGDEDGGGRGSAFWKHPRQVRILGEWGYYEGYVRGDGPIHDPGEDPGKLLSLRHQLGPWR